MATIHLIHGFMGFGKTTLAKELIKKYNAKHFCIDHIMLEKYGRNPQNFEKAFHATDNYIWRETAKLIAAGQNVILDYGFWEKETRKKVQEKALKFTPNVLWHQLICDIEVAKQRVLKRTQENHDELFIDENCFDERLKRYEPITDDEHLNVIKHFSSEKNMRKSARAIIITKNNKMLLMKRTKPDGVYYVTIGGGIEDGETSEEALLRELKEESGSIVEETVFAFHYDDSERQNSVDFYVCKEINRIKPTGTEWSKWNTPDNQYELVELNIDEIKNIPLKPDAVANKIIEVFEKFLES